MHQGLPKSVKHSVNKTMATAGAFGCVDVVTDVVVIGRNVVITTYELKTKLRAL